MKTGTLKIGINATSLLSPLTGVGTYTYQLCRQLEARGDCELHYFYGREWSKRIMPRVSLAMAATRSVARYVTPILYPLARQVQQLAFTRGAVYRGIDVYHEPNFIPFRFNGPLVTTIHDLSVIRYPETLPFYGRYYLKKYLPRAVKVSNRLITVSEFTANEVRDVFPNSAGRIRTIHNGLSETFLRRNNPDCGDILEEFGLKKQSYFLCVGTIEPRKNLAVVAQAYANLPPEVQERFPLAIVGGEGWKVAESLADFRELRKNGRAIFTGYVGTDRLLALYTGARVFVYISLYEGFGLPVIEAMACGVPVITSNRASLPEVAGRAALLVDPENFEQVSTALLQMSKDSPGRTELIVAGRERAADFSWERCAEETMATYREATGF